MQNRIARREHGAWVVPSLEELERVFELDAMLRPFLISQRWVTHLQMDYRCLPGVVHLGYTVLYPFVRVVPRLGGPLVELVIACEEGMLTKEEAIGAEWMPNSQEIIEHAARIRAGHETEGIIRRAEFVGFDIGRDYCAGDAGADLDCIDYVLPLTY